MCTNWLTPVESLWYSCRKGMCCRFCRNTLFFVSYLWAVSSLAVSLCPHVFSICLSSSRNQFVWEDWFSLWYGVWASCIPILPFYFHIFIVLLSHVLCVYLPSSSCFPMVHGWKTPAVFRCPSDATPLLGCPCVCFRGVGFLIVVSLYYIMLSIPPRPCWIPMRCWICPPLYTLHLPMLPLFYLPIYAPPTSYVSYSSIHVTALPTTLECQDKLLPCPHYLCNHSPMPLLSMAPLCNHSM